jgi:hypothetical protein
VKGRKRRDQSDPFKGRLSVLIGNRALHWIAVIILQGKWLGEVTSAMTALGRFSPT